MAWQASMLKCPREDLEVHLSFAGLLVMENSLKEETTGYLRVRVGACVYACVCLHARLEPCSVVTLR
jgi:hypothetical protein